MFQVQLHNLKGLRSSVFSHKLAESQMLKKCNVKEEEEEVEMWWEKGAGVEGGAEGQRGRARIDHPPGVMDSAISGSGQRRREESDFCFSKSWWMRPSKGGQCPEPSTWWTVVSDGEKLKEKREVRGWREDKSFLQRAGGRECTKGWGVRDKGHQGKCKWGGRGGF